MSHEAVATDVLLSGGGVWVVTGTCGYYSDQEWWIEAVAVSKEAAEALIAECEAWAAAERDHRASDDYSFGSPFHSKSPSRYYQDEWCGMMYHTEWTAEHLPSLADIPGVLLAADGGHERALAHRPQRQAHRRDRRPGELRDNLGRRRTRGPSDYTRP